MADRCVASAMLALLAVVGACCAGPEAAGNGLAPAPAVQSRADVFVEITEQLRAALDAAYADPNPFRGDPAAGDSYATAYRSAFAYGALGVGGWSSVGGDVAFKRGWSDGLHKGFLLWCAMADKYGYKW